MDFDKNPQVVALASYLPLSGSTFGVEGDGLIPVNTALMEGGQRMFFQTPPK